MLLGKMSLGKTWLGKPALYPKIIFEIFGFGHLQLHLPGDFCKIDFFLSRK
jgi:hypothetical protein